MVAGASFAVDARQQCCSCMQRTSRTSTSHRVSALARPQSSQLKSEAVSQSSSWPLRVLVPVRSEAETATKTATGPAFQIRKSVPANILADIVSPVKDDMEQMNRNLRNVVGNRHPMLMAAADQIFGAGGKKLRPMVVFLVARATAELVGLR